MSNGTDTISLVSELNAIQIDDYAQAASEALFLWYYITTLDKEVTLFWKPKLTGAAALYLANRYVGIFYNIADNDWWAGTVTYTGCVATEVLSYISYISQYVIWAVFSSLRVYALKQNWLWVGIVLLLALVPVATNITILSFTHIVLIPDEGCASVNPGLSLKLSNALLITSRVCLALADAIVVASTWSATYWTRGNSEDSLGHGSHMSLSGVLFRDGSIYFITLTILNFLLVVLTISSIETLDGPLTGPRNSVFIEFVPSLTTILVDRFLTDLHEAAAVSTGSERSQWSAGTLRFARSRTERMTDSSSDAD